MWNIYEKGIHVSSACFSMWNIYEKGIHLWLYREINFERVSQKLVLSNTCVMGKSTLIQPPSIKEYGLTSN